MTRLMLDSRQEGPMKSQGALEDFIDELVELGSPLALLCLMLVMAYVAPVVRVFALASISAAAVGLIVLAVLRFINKKGLVLESDSAPVANMKEQLRSYDQEMDRFWEEWKTP